MREYPETVQQFQDWFSRRTLAEIIYSGCGGSKDFNALDEKTKEISDREVKINLFAEN